MRVLQAAVAILGMHDPDATDNSHAANLRKAIRLTSQMATAICAHHRVRSGQEPVAPAPDLGHAANFLYMLSGKRPPPVTVKAFDASLTLYAEHELNASTYDHAGHHLDAVGHALGRGRRRRRAEGAAPWRRGRGGHAHADGDRRGGQGRRLRRAGAGRASAGSWASAIACTARAIRARRS